MSKDVRKQPQVEEQPRTGRRDAGSGTPLVAKPPPGGSGMLLPAATAALPRTRCRVPGPSRAVSWG